MTSPIITRGFGSFGSVSLVVTAGFLPTTALQFDLFEEATVVHVTQIGTVSHVTSAHAVSHITGIHTVNHRESL